MAQRLVAGRRLRAVEADQHLAGLHDVAFPDAQLLDDAALEVLHGLAVALDPDGARRDAALESGARAAQPPKPRKNSARISRPQHDDARTGGVSRHVDGRAVAGAAARSVHLMPLASDRTPSASAAPGPAFGDRARAG